MASEQSNADWWGSLRPQPEQQRRRERTRLLIRSAVAAVIVAALLGGVLAATLGGRSASAVTISDGVPELRDPNALVPGLSLGNGPALRARLVGARRGTRHRPCSV